ncbi:hypothetical protein NHX12_032747, partial [Muraenolepis orangiensis]
MDYPCQIPSLGACVDPLPAETRLCFAFKPFSNTVQTPFWIRYVTRYVLESHLASNVHKSRLAQHDLKVAKLLQEEEDKRAKAQKQRQFRDLERQDNEIAQEIQEELVRQAEKQRLQEEKDMAIAPTLGQLDKKSQHAPRTDSRSPSRIDDPHAPEYRDQTRADPAAHHSRSKYPQHHLAAEGERGSRADAYPEHSLPSRAKQGERYPEHRSAETGRIHGHRTEEAERARGRQRMPSDPDTVFEEHRSNEGPRSREGPGRERYHTHPPGEPGRIVHRGGGTIVAGHEYGLADATQGLTRLDLRDQEVIDMEVARRLHEEEIKASKKDKHAAQVAQDEEVARLLPHAEDVVRPRGAQGSREDHGGPRSREDHGGPRSREDHGGPRSREDHGGPRSREDHGGPRSREDYEHQRQRNQNKPTRPPQPRTPNYENVNPGPPYGYSDNSFSPRGPTRPEAAYKVSLVQDGHCFLMLALKLCPVVVIIMLCDQAIQQSGHIGASVVVCGHIGASVVVCGHIGASVVVCGHIGASVVVCGHIGASVVVCGHIGAS